MSSKRKTPARRKTSPAPSEKPIAATPVSPSVVETASPISAPVLVGAPSEPVATTLSAAKPEATAPAAKPAAATAPAAKPEPATAPAAKPEPATAPAGKPALVGLPAMKFSARSEPERAAAPRPAPAFPRISHDERHRLIAKVAYGYAEKAGFRNNPVEDWLTAEREVDAMLRLAS
jgi:Protein of unknown function (DUF2934)